MRRRPCAATLLNLQTLLWCQFRTHDVTRSGSSWIIRGGCPEIRPEVGFGYVFRRTALMDAVNAFLKYLAAHPEPAVQEEKADVVIIKALLYSKLAEAAPTAAKPAAAPVVGK
jgi:hypothetical protein